MEKPDIEEKGSKRRDFLLKIQEEMQAEWEEQKIYESNSPEDFDPDTANINEKNKEKFFTTFPYPYMNGRLHLGHGYSMSKNEFAARF
jgi:leucyl-tRNA synthetase